MLSALQTLLQVFEELGLPVAMDKLEGPVTQLTFLGFELDSCQMELRLPADKLSSLMALIESWLGRRSCTRKELESLVGSLGHATRVVPSGKTFLCRMYELLSIPRKSHYRARLNTSFKSDLLWWHLFLTPFNGVKPTRQLALHRPQFHFASDASGIGCGAIWTPYWFQFKWSQSPGPSAQLSEESITYKELLPIVVASTLWGR